MTEVYRLCKAEYAEDYSGTGARLYGGRWNEIGRAVLYTGYNREICVLEYLVNVEKRHWSNLKMLCLAFEGSIREVNEDELPQNWREYPAPLSLQMLTEKIFTAEQCYAIRVPSVILPSAFNYVLNTEHPDHQSFRCLSMEDFSMDQRY